MSAQSQPRTSSARLAAISLWASGLSLTALIAAGGSVSADEFRQETTHVSLQANVLRIRFETALADLPAPVVKSMRSVVKVSGTNVRDSQSTYSGSGVVIGDKSVATAKHVIMDASPIWIDIDGRRFPARVAAVHPTIDLCVLSTDESLGLSAVPMVTEQVLKNQKLYFGGYDPQGFRAWRARVLSFAYRMLESGGEYRSGSISGNSGGPAFNGNGELVSILFANGSSDTYSGAGTV